MAWCPRNVATLCTLTFQCESRNVHRDDAGYLVMTGAVAPMVWQGRTAVAWRRQHTHHATVVPSTVEQ